MDLKKIILIIATVIFLTGAGYLGWLWLDDYMHYAWYYNQKEAIGMKYPKGWKVVDAPSTGAIVGFVMPKPNALALFQANWNISYTKLQEEMSLEQYVKAADAQMSFLFGKLITAAQPVKLSGHNGYKLSYSSDKEGGLIIIAYFFIFKGVAYNITYADRLDEYSKSKTQQASVEKVIQSLKVGF